MPFPPADPFFRLAIDLQGFFHEHLHEDEEIRFIMEGSGSSLFSFSSTDDATAFSLEC